MRILLTVQTYQKLTGAEIYVYELARELKARGHEVVILSYIGGEITERTRKLGIPCYDFTETNDRPLPEKPFDIIHAQQSWPTQYVHGLYPNVPLVKTIHSTLESQKEWLHPSVLHYIAIRPEIAEKLAEEGIKETQISLIWNGIDMERFKPRPKLPRQRKLVLFAGTVDPFRREAAQHLMREADSQDFDIWFIGHRYDTYLDITSPHAEYLGDARWDIEELLCQVDETAGIFLGRTTIEGWAMGKPGVIYDIGENTMIKGIQRIEVPTSEEMEQFDIKYMTDKIYEIYTRFSSNHLS